MSGAKCTISYQRTKTGVMTLVQMERTATATPRLSPGTRNSSSTAHFLETKISRRSKSARDASGRAAIEIYLSN